MKNGIAKLLTLGTLAWPAVMPGVANAGGQVDLVPNTSGLLVDVVALGKTPGDVYTGGFCRARAMHTWAEEGDNVFMLCEGSVGYKGVSLGLQERFMASADYQVAPFAGLGLKGKVDVGEHELSGSASFGASLPDPTGVLELRLAGSADIESSRWYVPNTVEAESFTWRKAEGISPEGFSGAERAFVGYSLGGLTFGPSLEVDWSVNEGAKFAPGLKIRYGE